MFASAPAGFRGLDVWQKSMSLAEAVYDISQQLPETERFGLLSQLRRAAVSVPSNIAEGYGRGGGDDHRFVLIARGSLMELETPLELAMRLGFFGRERLEPAWMLTQDVGRMLTKLAAALRES